VAELEVDGSISWDQLMQIVIEKVEEVKAPFSPSQLWSTGRGVKKFQMEKDPVKFATQPISEYIPDGGGLMLPAD
jgi:hypothetical protein